MKTSERKPELASAHNVLHIDHDGGLIRLKEPCGFNHETQVIQLTLPDSFKGKTGLKDAKSNRYFPLQASLQNENDFFLQLDLQSHEALELHPDSSQTPAPGVSIQKTEEGTQAIISNAKIEIKVAIGKTSFTPQTSISCKNTPGPLLSFRLNKKQWLGKTFFDSSNRVLGWEGRFLEDGPLRVVYAYRVDFEGGNFYEASLTLDEGMDFVRIDESFQNERGAQMVWDFAQKELPQSVLKLNPTASYEEEPLHYYMDLQHAKVGAWTQYSQLQSDGFAVKLKEDQTCIGFIALEGGKWEGNGLNHIEAWSRRWDSEDRSTRREVPHEAKADAFPGPEHIPSRIGQLYQSHFTAESWIGYGKRSFALVISPEREIIPQWQRKAEESGLKTPPQGIKENHFEFHTDRNVFQDQVSRLRLIHTQHGVMPLQSFLSMCFEWPEEPLRTALKDEQSEDSRLHRLIIKHLLKHKQAPQKDFSNPEYLIQFMETRIYGFWEGNGSPRANCVISRPIPFAMLHYEKLLLNEELTGEQAQKLKAYLIFISYLFASENTYPGESTMQPVGEKNSTEPYLAGMANQNFYTDFLNLHGMAAQVFHQHPEAPSWRKRFIEQWRLQLKYHVYEESGVWEESQTYFQHVLKTVIPLFIRQRIDDIVDLFADERFHKMASSAIKAISIRDKTFEGYRYMLPFGDHHVDVKPFRFIYAEMARGLYPHNPELGSQFAWFYQEMGGSPINGIPAKAPEWHHEYIQGFGFIFRNRDTNGQESLMALRSGAAWGHHHHDEGSIQFYAHEQSLIVDAAHSEPLDDSYKIFAEGQSRTKIAHAEPLNYLWRFNRGWIIEHQAEGLLPYAVAFTPTYCTLSRVGKRTIQPLAHAFREFRALVQLTPTTYLLIDYVDSTIEHSTHFHLTSHDITPTQSGFQAKLEEGQELIIQPLLGEPPHHSTQKQPNKLNEHLTTTSLDLKIEKGKTLLPYLISAGAADSCKITDHAEGDESQLKIATDKTAFTIDIENHSLITVTESTQSHSIQIDFTELSSKTMAEEHK